MSFLEWDWDRIIKEFIKVKREDTNVLGAILELIAYPFLKDEFGELQYPRRLDFKAKDKDIYIEVKKRWYLDDEQKKAVSFLMAYDSKVYFFLFDDKGLKTEDIKKVFYTFLGPAYLVKLKEPPSIDLFRLYRLERVLLFTTFILEAALVTAKLINVQLKHIKRDFRDVFINFYESIVDQALENKKLREAIKKDFREGLRWYMALDSTDPKMVNFILQLSELIRILSEKAIFMLIDLIGRCILSDVFPEGEIERILREIPKLVR